MSQDRERLDRFLPMKPLVFDILMALSDGKSHGWALVRDVQQREGGAKILPANFYRTLRMLKEEGLIEDAPADSNEDANERRQYFRLTTLGTRVARAEALRIKALIVDPRVQKLLKAVR